MKDDMASSLQKLYGHYMMLGTIIMAARETASVYPLVTQIHLYSVFVPMLPEILNYINYIKSIHKEAGKILLVNLILSLGLLCYKYPISSNPGLLLTILKLFLELFRPLLYSLSYTLSFASLFLVLLPPRYTVSGISSISCRCNLALPPLLSQPVASLLILRCGTPN